MHIHYILTEQEISFLKEISIKEYPINAWSGRLSDDAFITKWKEEINSFKSAGLVEKKDNGCSNSYWCYGLNDKGLKIQKEYIEKRF